MRVADFDFELPEEQIAQHPRPRGASRLLVVDRASGTWDECAFRDLPARLDPGDVLVANDTRVFPARLIGRRDPSGGRVECLLLERESDADWSALVHPGQKLKTGARMVFDDPARAPGVRVDAEILARRYFGRRLVRLAAHGADTVEAAVDALGHVPLPPYIARPDTAADRDRYQTVFADARGSVAAPTAGLHFDAATIDAIRARGVSWTTVTLHVGYGTFKPVRVDRVEDHVVDTERYAIPDRAAGDIGAARSAGRRRHRRRHDHDARAGVARPPNRETCAVAPASTDVFIYPGYQFKIVDGLLTNFHLPRSSLLMLVCAFAGRELVLEAYRDAVAEGFRFYSYGDCMLIR